MPVDKSQDRVKQMFAEIAGKYDRMNHLLSMNVDRYWRRRTVQLVPPIGADPILDVCTGTGDLAFAYQKKAEPGTEVFATDFCPEMLEIADQKKAKEGLNGEIFFSEADTMHLPFDDDKFQIVCVAFGLRNVADTDAGLAEMVRVALPRGRVAILEFSMPQWQPFKGVYHFYFHQILPRIGQRMATNRKQAYNYLPESVGEFPSGRELVDRLQATGLLDIRVHPFTMGIATLYVGTKG